MSDEDYERAGDELTRHVEAHPDRRVRGAELGQEIRRTRPGLLSTITLTRLLNTYAPRLTVVGRAGDDLVWGLDRDDDAPLDEDIDQLLSIDDDGPRAQVPLPEGGLERVRLRDYRSIRDLTLDLEPLTVLVGPNGAGKSNILDGIFRGVLLTKQKADTVFDGPNALSRIRRRPDGRPRLELEGGGWSMTFDPGDPEHRTPFEIRQGAAQHQLASLLSTSFRKAFGPAVRLHLSANMLARPTWSRELEPYLRNDGFFLSSVLAWLAGADRERLDCVLERVRAVVPQVEDLRTLRVRIPEAVTEVLRIDGQEIRRAVVQDQFGHALEVKVHGSWTPADQLSEGTLLLIGLHTLLSREPSPRVVLIDDLDRALHPNAQRKLVEQLQGLVGPRRKIVTTSHSPFVLDPLPPEAIRLVQTDEEGATVLGRLTDHPEWPRWEGVMTPAEFWQYAGDEWLRPSAS